MAEIVINVPHAVTILPDETCGFDGATYPPEAAEVPRAVMTIAELGAVAYNDEVIPIKSAAYRATSNLPPPMPGVMRVVSQITVLAAHMEGRPTDDLLVPYGFQCTPGQPVGAQALAISECADPDKPDQDAVPMVFSHIRNTGGRHESIYPQAPDAHACEPKKDLMPIVFEPAPHEKQLAIVYEKVERDVTLTEQYGVPIVRTRVSHVSGLETIQSGALGIVEPRIRMALGGAIMSNGSYVGAMVGDEVRSTQGSRKGSVIGGRSLFIPPLGAAMQPRI